MLLSTHAIPTKLFGVPYLIIVPQHGGEIRNQILTIRMHHEYTIHMKDIDVANQLWASYSCQSKLQKWWNRVFDFLFDQMEMNMYVLYLGQVKQQNTMVPPITYLMFKLRFCESLIATYKQNHELACIPWDTRLHRQCKETQDHYYSSNCEINILCLNKTCIEKYHVVLEDHVVYGRLRDIFFPSINFYNERIYFLSISMPKTYSCHTLVNLN